MGHKVHPIGIRLGISADWNSKWYANKAEFAGYLAADLKVRQVLRKKCLRLVSVKYLLSVLLMLLVLACMLLALV